MKNQEEIEFAVKKAQTIVQNIYKDDPRIQKANSADSGIARETDIVFEKVLEYILNKE